MNNEPESTDLLVRALWHLELVSQKYGFRMQDHERKQLNETIENMRGMM